MSTALAYAGAATGLGLLSAFLWRRTRCLGSRLDTLARPLHELRGALAALELGLSYAERANGWRQELNGCADSLHISLDRAALAARDIEILRLGAPTSVDVKVQVDFQALVLRSARAWSFLASTYPGSLEVDWRAGPVRVLGHAGRLQQALDNLIANALEHGGSCVVIEGERRDDVVRILISDGGSGLPRIPGGALAEATVPTPVARTTRSARGHGLSIAGEVIREHNGRLALGMGRNGPGVLVELPTVRGDDREAETCATHDVGFGANGRTPKAA
jgi:signal transduction histidine kinase